MKFFKLIRTDIDVFPFLSELWIQEEAWTLDTTRQNKITVQRNTDAIPIRKQTPRPDLSPNENQECRFTAFSKRFPHCVGFLEGFASEMNAYLSRAMIVRLKPNAEVFRHVDAGSYYFIRDRYHLVLHSKSGSVLISGDEQVRMQPGELWWFDNKQYHEARNDSDEWRIHCIFDLLPKSFSNLAVNPIKPRDALRVVGAEAPSPNSSRDALRAAIAERAILRSESQLLIGPKGTRNKWLIDIRRLLLEAPLLTAIADQFWALFAERLPFQVGGLEVGAIPLIAAILMKSAQRGTPVNGFFVRKERKTYGTGGLIEGTLNDAPVVVVDDILHSGNSFEKVRVALEMYDRDIEAAFVVIDYRSAKSLAWRTRHAIAVHSLFDLAEFGLPKRQPGRSAPQATFLDAWSFAAPNPNFFHRVPKSFPATDGQRVYFGSDSGIFWCLHAVDGSVAWKFEVTARGHKNLWSAPALHDGRVYFGSYDGNVYCLNAQDGTEIWRFIGADWVGSSPALAPELGLLFIGLEFSVEGKRGSVVALNLQTGEKVWEHMTKRYTHASPAFWPDEKLVACGSNDNEIFLFSAATGTVLWRFETNASRNGVGSVRHAPAFDVRRGHVVTGCANGVVYIIDVASGREVWSVRTGNTIYSIPLIVNDSAYIGSTDKFLYVLDLEQRRVRKRIYAGSKIFSPPRLLEGRIYFGACNGIVYELSPENDTITGMHQLPDAVTNAVTYNEKTRHFYALTYVNQLFAFSRVPDASPREVHTNS